MDFIIAKKKKKDLLTIPFIFTFNLKIIFFYVNKGLFRMLNKSDLTN